ncbi:MAG TPA: methylmalonyl-CoA mutase [Dehalococcoidia bacterium]|jgi:methylmalonyl-CoA mutase C-terminal domain/subunit|nr:methylmalonyl-CoA mutase [Dehalococcoidia bacterium]
MAQPRNKIKVLLAQFPLETHSRGIITVAGMLKDAGMEVVLIGNELPERIIDAAIQEDVDVVGISTYCGGELALADDLMKAAEEKGIKESTVFLLGGIFPPKNIPKLKEMGFDGTFLSTTKEEIVSCIEKAIASKRRR